MPLPVSFSNGVKVYNLVSDKNIPKWESASGSRKKKTSEYKRRIEILQDFEFPSSCSRIRISPDGEHLLTIGTYKPRIKSFDLSQLSLKFERHLDFEGEDLIVLSEDYTKFCVLRKDRFLEFHTRFGCHFRTRIPKRGRNLVYNQFNCDLSVSASNNEVFRLNLEKGIFKKPFKTTLNTVNHAAFNTHFRFYAFAGEDGLLECHDERAKQKISVLKVHKSILDIEKDLICKNNSIEKVIFDEQKKLRMAVGTAEGQVALYDIRMCKPLFVKDHRNEMPITDLDFHSSGKLVSSDTKSIKFWDIKKQAIFTSILPESKINGFCLNKNSGVVFAACDSPKIHAYLIPSLGEAPKWCSFLENITEELEEEQTETIYDDYKFVTVDELKEIEGENLLGTDKLKPYLHGYFMNYKLYAKLKATVTKSELKDFIKSGRREKLEERLEERINAVRRPSKAKKRLAGKLGRATREKQNVLEDERFQRMFEEPDFRIDTNSAEYKLRYSTTRKKDMKEDIEESDKEAELLENE